MIANRLQLLPEYVFSKINEKKNELINKGIDVIDLGIGDPDLPTPPHIVSAMKEALNDPNNFQYPPYEGIPEFKEAVAEFYLKNYHVHLDPDSEVLMLIGSKEGIFHLIPAVVNPSDIVLIPDPGYPVYQTAVQLAGGTVHYIPLFDYLTHLHCLPEEIRSHASLMFLNFPNNPSSATVDLDFFENVVSYAKKHGIPVAHDFAYGRVTFNNYKAPSILQAKDAKDICIEFGSFSKTYCMTGWRIGYAVGNSELIKALSIIKSHADTGQFIPIQKAAIQALNSSQDSVLSYNQIYYKRMRIVLDLLNSLDIKVKEPKGSIFVWAQVPEGYSSQQFSEELLEKEGIVVTPGIAFGQLGEGFFRIALTVEEQRLKEAGRRLRHFFLRMKNEIGSI